MADYSINKPIWPGSSSFTAGDTPFGYFDTDPVFISHVDKFATYAARQLGYPILDVELQDINFYTAFEGAIIEYSNQVNQINIANNLLNTLGINTGSQYLQGSLTGKLVNNSLSYVTKLSKAYGTEADSGGNVTWHSASIDIVPGQQTYSITDAVKTSLGISGSAPFTSSVEIKRVLHNTPPALVRYFDPFVGTGLGSQQMMDAFDFGGFSPSVNFMMMPLHADLLRIQSIEFNDRIRKSHFSFELHGDNIKIYPVPGLERGTSRAPFFEKVWFEYIYSEDKALDAFGNMANLSGSISDASNIPYTYQKYSSINDMGRSWILKYALATAKEMLGNIRSKYSSIPIPNSEVTLNGGDLLTQAQAEQSMLIEQLREFLSKMTKEGMLERQANENRHMTDILSSVPLKIYIGSLLPFLLTTTFGG